ncbi:hypothetical protein [Leucobacter sp.]
MTAPSSVTENRPTRLARLRSLAVRALRVELRIYESLWRVIARRPRIAPAALGFRYHRPVLTVLIIFIVLSAVEIPILDLIVHRWTPVRIGVLVIGIWGLTWMLGLLCAYLSRPHTVGPQGIRVREGLELDIPVRWDDFASIRLHAVAAESIDPTSTEKPGRVFVHDGRRVCAIWVGAETNLEIELEGPAPVRLPGLPPRGGTHEVELLRFWADAPRGLLEAVRRQLDLGDAASAASAAS